MLWYMQMIAIPWYLIHKHFLLSLRNLKPNFRQFWEWGRVSLVRLSICWSPPSIEDRESKML